MFELITDKNGYDYFRYAIYLIAVWLCIKIIFQNRNAQKTVSYLLLLIVFPLAGIVVYYVFGIKHRTKRSYNHKKQQDAKFFKKIRKNVSDESEKVLNGKHDLPEHQQHLARLLLKDSLAQVSTDNRLELLINGEKKFPQVLKALESAVDHIHLEYYIYDNDEIGNKIKELLIKKCKEGVKVRFIYDDFGSRAISKKFAAELRKAGVEVYAFYKTYFVLLANRWNNRNHRKIIIVDGRVGFIGGINVSDRYMNGEKQKNVFWRDTHLMLEGTAVATLQRIFISDWNFCSEGKLGFNENFFPVPPHPFNQVVQIVSSGPDSERASIMLGLFSAIVSASKSIYITTPYFIPNESILTALQQAALGGVDVRLLVPQKSDIRLVDVVTESHFTDLLEAGVRIFLYSKGFVHAKTMVVDDNLAVIGTANMDMRSFEFNFEVNAFVYGNKLNKELTTAFEDDLTGSRELTLKQWNNRKTWRKAAESLARLVAPVL